MSEKSLELSRRRNAEILERNKELEDNLTELKEKLENESNEYNFGYQIARDLIADLELMQVELKETIDELNKSQCEYREIISELKKIKDDLFRSKESESFRQLLEK